MEFKKKNLLDIKSLTKEEILHILDTARGFLDIPTRTVKKVPALKGMTVINCFYEPSTRTRTSFELAAKRLSADTINFSSGGSSVEKGETLKDTALNLQAMAPDCIILRHPLCGAPHFLAKKLNCSIVNAGDGTHEHPTQALLDAFTIMEKKGKINGLNITILGDILHSRVAKSNIYCLNKLGAKVKICGPETLIPQYIEKLNVEVCNNLDDALTDSDVVMVLRIQKERIHGSAFPSIREYFKLFGLNLEKLKKAKKDVIVMHPGPMNRGVEISTDVADGPFSVILDQVSNGMAVRMAVLYLLLIGRKKSEETT